MAVLRPGCPIIQPSPDFVLPIFPDLPYGSQVVVRRGEEDPHMPLPKLTRVRQTFDTTRLEDAAAAVAAG